MKKFIGASPFLFILSSLKMIDTEAIQRILMFKTKVVKMGECGKHSGKHLLHFNDFLLTQNSANCTITQ
jgi:hypothetical protein